MLKEALWTRNFICATLANFFVFLVFYYLLVTLPAFSLATLDVNPAQAGLVATAFFISAITIRPIVGHWLEIGNKQKILGLSVAVLILSCGLYLLADSFLVLLAIRFLHGLGFGMATVSAGAIVAEIIPENRRAEGFGYFTLSLNVAVVAGPFFGLLVYQNWGPATLFDIAVICSLIGVLPVVLIRNPGHGSEPVPETRSSTGKAIFEPSALRISIVAGIFSMVYSSILAFVPVYAEERSMQQASAWFFIFYAGAMLLSRPFTGRWSDRYGPDRIIYPAIISLAMGMFVLSLSRTIPVFLLAAALTGLGWGTLFANFQTLAVQDAPTGKRALAMATFMSVFDTGIGLGTFLVGVVVTQTGLPAFYFYGSIFIVAAILIYNSIYYRVLWNNPFTPLAPESKE